LTEANKLVIISLSLVILGI